MTSPFEAGIDACGVWPNGKAYFFKGDSYLRFDIATDRVDQDPRPIRGNWPGWPESWADGIQGAIAVSSQRAYFFRGGEYLRYDIAADRVDQLPRPIAGFWPGWPVAWNDSIDGCVNWGNGLVYFFKGANFIRYDLNQDRVTREPTQISAAWGNWPFPWNARMNGGGVWPTGTAYLFSGSGYIRYSVAADAALGSPAPIKDNWIGWPGYVAPAGLRAGTYTIKSAHNKYLSRDGSNISIVGDRVSASTWEKFTLKRNGAGWTLQDWKGWYWVRLVGAVSLEPFGTSQTLSFGVRDTEYTDHSGNLTGGSTTWDIQHVSGNDYAFKIICSVAPPTYVTAEPAGTMAINRVSRDSWETFTLTRVGD